jgi:hypothetical protein
MVSHKDQCSHVVFLNERKHKSQVTTWPQLLLVGIWQPTDDGALEVTPNKVQNGTEGN